MSLRITTLSENTAGRIDALAEWGLSILIEMDGHKILFDTGLNMSAIHNADLLRVDLTQLDRIVLSHGHRDHTGGLYKMLNRINKQIEIIAHPDVWANKYIRSSSGKDRYLGIPFAREALEGLGASFNLTKEPVWLSDNIVTTGEIPMYTEYEKIEPNLQVKEGEKFLPDPLWDDQAIIIKTEKGLVVILGCAHRGTINTLHHAQKLTGVETIHMIIGGMHLIYAAEERIYLTIGELRGFNIQRLGVSHCTGLPASAILAQEFGDSFFFNNAGNQIEV